MRDINQTKDSFKNRIMSFLSMEILLNAFKMNDEDIAQYIKMINNSKISHIMGYVDAVYQIARYIQKTDTKIKPVKSIMACAGTVTDDIRTLIEKTFGAKVHNKYGSRDCADMVCECDKGGLHIYSNYILIEVVDSMGNPLSSGEKGRILVTLIGNISFPLIRYEIGDIGALSCKSCECGRPFPLMEHLEGRTVEFLVNSNGGYVTPAYIIHLIGVVHNPGFIKRFQLIQLSLKNLELKLELETNVSDKIYQKAIANIIKDLKTVFGEDCNILHEILQDIPETDSGKFLYTINKYKKIS
jgi:phenylacetate-CoA ligase